VSTFWQIILATFAISLISFVGIFTISAGKKNLSKITIFLVSFSAGTMMGGAFLHLLPEAAENFDPRNLNLIVLSSFIIFLLIEKILHWRHCHKQNCSVHSFGYINIIGDGVHNFIDGLIIAASFVVSPILGISTTIAIAFHEIPQEIGDFGVLIHAGFSRKKAMLLNFLSAVTSIGGGVLGYFAAGKVDWLAQALIPFAAGGFIYIAASDLIPEIRKEKLIKKSIINLALFVGGISLFYFL
jgi:zinc and cadmium transporter